MSPQLRGYAIRVAGFIYGILGYGLSIFTYILGATMRSLFFPPIRRAALRFSMGLDTTVPAQGPDLRRSRRSKKWSSGRWKTPHGHDSGSLASVHGRLVPDDLRLRHATSLDSFRADNSFVLVTPVITVNHVDRVDNISIKAPTITIHPGASSDSGSKQSSKRRSATISHQPLPPLSSADLPVGVAPALPNLETSWNDNLGIHRSVSSPQLTSFAETELSALERKRKEKIHVSLPPKGGKRSKRYERIADSVASPSPSLKFFPSFPNITKKRSHTLRTQPYNEPYCVPLPVPPDYLGDLKLEKKFKRSRTLPPEDIGYTSPLNHEV